MKGKFIQNCYLLLVSNNLKKFEHKLSNHFLYYFGKLLPLNHSSLDWLVIKLRPIRKQSIPQWRLNSDYIEAKSFHSFTDRKKFVSLLQFLGYAQNLDFTTDYLGSTSYRLVVFRVQDFFKYQNPTCKLNNY